LKDFRQKGIQYAFIYGSFASGKEQVKFLLNLHIEAKNSKRKAVFAELTYILNERDFEVIAKSSKDLGVSSLSDEHSAQTSLGAASRKKA
jgi:hypothetical protein